MDQLAEPQLSKATYDWSVRAFSTIKRLLSINIKLHHEVGQVDAGDIFLFNHFARFETFIPQYLIHQTCGAYCRSVAAAEFFEGDDAFANFLWSVGAVPNNHPRLLPLLAEEILHGRKVVVFPEGGMVKDRRVFDQRGRYSIYSPTAKQRRKHHSGPAVLALVLDFFKIMMRRAEEQGDLDVVERWAEQLRFETLSEFLDAISRPTSIVPANITFYPIRVGDNLLRQGVTLFNRKLNRHFSEELMVEGNLLLKHTDMDIRLGNLIYPAYRWRWWDQFMARRFYRSITSFDQLFDMRRQSGHWDQKGFVYLIRRKASRLRDEYMHRIYGETTINLSHLASSVILGLMEQGRTLISQDEFHRTVYLALKKAQEEGEIHLHRSLCNPDFYTGLLTERTIRLEQFFTTIANMGLVEQSEEHYRFLPKLCESHEFDDVRLNNLVEVYANEGAPVPAVGRAVAHAMKTVNSISAREFALLRFDDERIALRADRAAFSKERHKKINDLETATADPAPYLEVPHGATCGVVLVHGFLASPAELREFGNELLQRGIAVVGVRLRGHGTSPWDLRQRNWEEWLESVRCGYETLKPFVERLAIVGFSTGGALGLRLAAETPERLMGVVSVSAPIVFRNKKLMFVPLIYGLNRIVRWVPALEGVRVFEPNEPEHPEINYRHIPIRSLYELMKFRDDYPAHLPQVASPALVLQGDNDPVVDPQSAQLILEKIGSRDKELVLIPAARHGILNENIGQTRTAIHQFLDRVFSTDASSTA